MSKRYTRKFIVTIDDKTTTVYTEDVQSAIDRAVGKLFGANCFWFADSGLAGYGQVFQGLRATKDNSNPGNSSVTSRVGITIEKGEPSPNFLQQQADDRTEEQAYAKEMEIEDDLKHAAFTAGTEGAPLPSGNIYQDDYEDGKRAAADLLHEQEEEKKKNEREQEEYLKTI